MSQVECLLEVDCALALEDVKQIYDSVLGDGLTDSNPDKKVNIALI